MLATALVAALALSSSVVEAKKHHHSHPHKSHHAHRSSCDSSPSSQPSSSYDNRQTSSSPSTSANHAAAGGAVVSSANWHLVKSVEADGIFEYFNFETTYSGNSGTGGIAQYLSQQDAQSKGMIGVNGGLAYLGVDTGSAISSGRNSIRVSSKDIYNSGTLLVIDVAHMPTGCGTWPAIWTVAQDGAWPEKGELDIVEGVSEFNVNALSAHTKAGFTMQTDGFSADFLMQGSDKTHCDAYATNDQGCGLRDPDLTSFGKGFNSGGGATFVLEWVEEHIAMYMFNSSSLPSDLSSGQPTPGHPGWGTPRALFRDASGQQTSNYFQDHVLVLNTNLCGQWPGALWHQADSSAGQDQSCAASTGFSSCEAYVKANGGAFKEAYFAVRGIKVYSQ